MMQTDRKVKGRQRQVVVDIDGQGLVLDPQPGPALRLSCRSFPFASKAFADSEYAGDRPVSATPVISRSFASRPTRSASRFNHAAGWLSASSPGSVENRRLWKDPRRHLPLQGRFSTPFSVMILLRRLARA